MANNAGSKVSGSLGNSLMAGMARLRECCERMERHVRERADLSEAQCWLLTCVPTGEPVVTGDLCHEAGLSPSRGGRVIEELVQRGLLLREADARDRRVARLVLTPRGLALQRELSSLLQACEEAVIGRLTPGELDTVRVGLSLLTRAMSVSP